MNLRASMASWFLADLPIPLATISYVTRPAALAVCSAPNCPGGCGTTFSAMQPVTRQAHCCPNSRCIPAHCRWTLLMLQALQLPAPALLHRTAAPAGWWLAQPQADPPLLTAVCRPPAICSLTQCSQLLDALWLLGWLRLDSAAAASWWLARPQAGLAGIHTQRGGQGVRED